MNQVMLVRQRFKNNIRRQYINTQFNNIRHQLNCYIEPQQHEINQKIIQRLIQNDQPKGLMLLCLKLQKQGSEPQHIRKSKLIQAYKFHIQKLIQIMHQECFLQRYTDKYVIWILFLLLSQTQNLVIFFKEADGLQIMLKLSQLSIKIKHISYSYLCEAIYIQDLKQTIITQGLIKSIVINQQLDMNDDSLVDIVKAILSNLSSYQCQILAVMEITQKLIQNQAYDLATIFIDRCQEVCGRQSVVYQISAKIFQQNWQENMIQ